MDKELIEKIAEELEPHMFVHVSSRLTLANMLTKSILALIRSAGYVQRWKECQECHGDGKDHYLLRCDGKGIIRNVDHCPTCNGTGKVPAYVKLADKGKNE